MGGRQAEKQEFPTYLALGIGLEPMRQRRPLGGLGGAVDADVAGAELLVVEELAL